MSSSSRHGSARQPGAGASGRTLPAIDADRVAALAAPVVWAMDLDLEGVKITAAGHRRVLRVVVDGDGGVSLDDIALASRELSAVLDDSDVMGDYPYTLEVSSPGVDRALTEARHWRRAIGRLVTVPLAAAGPAVEGRVTEVSVGGITLDVDGESRQLGFGELGPGRVKIEFARIATDDDADAERADEGGPDGY
ncbi:MAG: ribosome maturation factor RimP [Streptosporangiaceae bacterium]